MKHNLDEIIKILKQKNYLIKCYDTPNLGNLIRVIDLITELKKSDILNSDDETNNILSKAIEKYFIEEISIVFKKEYCFQNIPNNYQYVYGQLFCFISPINLEHNFAYKNLYELELEVQNNINILYDWATGLDFADANLK